jgi:hypothetical protein
MTVRMTVRMKATVWVNGEVYAKCTKRNVWSMTRWLRLVLLRIAKYDKDKDIWIDVEPYDSCDVESTIVD